MKKNFKKFFTEETEYGSYFRKLKEEGAVEIKKPLSAVDPGRLLLKYRDIKIDLQEHFVTQRAKYKARNFMTDDQICEMVVKFIDKLYEVKAVYALDTPTKNIEACTYLVYSKVMHAALMLSKYKGVRRTYNLFNIFPQKSKNEKYFRTSPNDKEIIIEGLEPEVSNEFIEYLQYLSIEKLSITEEDRQYCEQNNCNLSKTVKFADGTNLTLLLDNDKVWDIADICFFELD